MKMLAPQIANYTRSSKKCSKLVLALDTHTNGDAGAARNSPEGD